MAWLRPILLAAGAVFMVLLIWRERRRVHQSQDGEKGGERDRRTTPGIDWSGAQVPIGPDPPLVATPPMFMDTDDEVPLGPAVAAAAEHAIPELPALRVEWPADDERHIVALRIVAARQDRLAGRALRQGLAGCGFRHGQLGIFHLPADDGRVVLSAASLVRPGTLDPATMDVERFAGVNLFAVLPGPMPPRLALERLAAVAEELAGRVAGLVQDESGAPFTGAARAKWRERCMSAVDAGGAPAEPAH
jgi:FtsZ-interacting cell division protein ZipA